MMIDDDDYDYEEGEEEDLIIQAAATTAIATGLSAMEYSQVHYNKRCCGCATFSISHLGLCSHIHR
jgi:hypothetical protein